MMKSKDSNGNMLKDFMSNPNMGEEISTALEQVKTLLWKDLKGWTDFFAVLKLPQWTYKHLEQRITTNLVHYRSNYLVLCLIIYVIQLIFEPLILVSLLLVGLINIYALVLTKKKPLVFGDITISDKGKKMITIGVSVIFLILSGALSQLIWSTIYCILLCGFHATFRPRSVTSKTNKLYEELKLNGFSWFGGAGSSFNDKSNDSDPENPSVERMDRTDTDSNKMSNEQVRKRHERMHSS